MWDGVAGAAIASIMGGMGLYLARLNQRYLLGQAVDKDIMTSIKQVEHSLYACVYIFDRHFKPHLHYVDFVQILKSRNSIDDVHSEQSQWIGPTAFIYKAEVVRSMKEIIHLHCLTANAIICRSTLTALGWQPSCSAGIRGVYLW